MDARVTEDMLAALSAAGLRAPALDDSGRGVEGVVSVAGRELRLRLDFPTDFPLSLPVIRVLEHEALGFVPHLTQIGVVCYHEGEGTVQSLWRPARVAGDALVLALETLGGSLEEGHGGGFAQEMEWWWSRQPGSGYGYFSWFEPGDQLKVLFERGGQIVDRKRASELRPGEDRAEGLYLPLAASVYEGSFDPRALLRPDSLRRILHAHLDVENRKRFRARLRRGGAWNFVVLGVPRPSGDRAIVGVRFDRPLNLRRVRGSAREVSIARCQPVMVMRSDRNQALVRGGADPRLHAKKVAIVGVGAVGGYVADAMARTGVGELRLIDPDFSLAENAYRHTLGFGSFGIPVHKATLLAAELSQRLVHLRCGGVPMRVQDALRLGSFVPSDFDLIIVALGAPTVSRWLNRELRARGGPPVIHTWIEPLGVGGHALLTTRSGAGCYECLFVDEDGGELLAPRSDFVAPNQDTLSRYGGCGAAFTPFSDLDARRTAELAVRLGVEALRRRAEGPRLRSWRGEREAVDERGLELSSRYDQTQEQLDAAGGGVSRRSCRVCGSRRGEPERFSA